MGTVSETDFGYTGQRALGDLGLMDYHARMYNPLLMRFVQPDSIIPDAADPQTWDRYSYVGNNPIDYNDPTGNCRDGERPHHCKARLAMKAGITSNSGRPLINWNVPVSGYSSCLTIACITGVTNFTGGDNSTSGITLNTIGGSSGDKWWNDNTPFTVQVNLIHISTYSVRYPANPPANPYNAPNAYIPTAGVLGFNYGAGAGWYNTAGAEDVFMVHNGKVGVQAFSYAGQGNGLGGDIAPYGGLVFNLKDFKSYTGAFTTFNLNVGIGHGFNISYFYDANAYLLEPGAIQGFTFGPAAVGASGSTTETWFEEIP